MHISTITITKKENVSYVVLHVQKYTIINGLPKGNVNNNKVIIMTLEY